MAEEKRAELQLRKPLVERKLRNRKITMDPDLMVFHVLIRGYIVLESQLFKLLLGAGVKLLDYSPGCQGSRQSPRRLLQF